MPMRIQILTPDRPRQPPRQATLKPTLSDRMAKAARQFNSGGRPKEAKMFDFKFN